MTNTHRHWLSYAYAISTTPSSAGCAIERGVCGECGQKIARAIPYGSTSSGTRAMFAPADTFAVVSLVRPARAGCVRGCERETAPHTGACLRSNPPPAPPAAPTRPLTEPDSPNPAQVAAVRELLAHLVFLTDAWGPAPEPEPRWALPGDVARSKGLPTPAEALKAGVHGYGGADDYGWAPGYCWCGAWALEEGPEHPGKPCAGLTAIFGRPPRSHEDALRLAYLRGVDGSAP